MLDIEKALRRAERERTARKIAEQVLEEKSSELYFANEQLEKSKATLELRVLQRTEELAVAIELLRSAAEESHLANQAKGDFLARMSHEIRTPMNGIVGLTELLLQTPLQQRQHDYLKMIQSSATGLLEIINDILDFSRIEAGKLELSETEFNFQEAILEVSRVFALRAEQKGLEFVLTIASDVPSIVRGDAQRLSQVLINLIGNSLKFTHEGLICVDVSVEQNSNDISDILIVVSDSGIGIPTDKQELIFQPFDQADGTTSRHFGGSGLGLSISKQIAEMMDGSISVSSTAGKGSKFSLRIRIEVVRRFGSVDAAMVSSLRGKHCLIVESNSRLLGMIQVLLNDCRCRCTTAGSVKEARLAVEEAISRNEPFDIAFISTRLADGFGESVVEALWHLEQVIPMVLMRTVTETQPIDGESADYNRDVAEYILTKPFLPEELLTVAGQALSGSPRKSFADQSSQVRSEWMPVARPSRILLVDDMPVNRAVAHGMLTKLGHEVQCAENGLAALRWVQQSTFDIVFLDIQMPEMDGLTAASMIRQLDVDTQSRVPLVALTANAFSNDREKYLSAGFDDYLSKPFMVEDLMKIVDRWGRKENAGTAIAAPLDGAVMDTVPQRGHSQSIIDDPGARDVIVQQSPATFDSKFLMRQVCNNMELMKTVVGIYETSLSTRTEELLTAVASEDFSTVESIAHALKGTCGSLGGTRAAETARALESAVGQKRPEEWKPIVDTLLHDARDLSRELNEFLDEHRTADAVISNV